MTSPRRKPRSSPEPPAADLAGPAAAPPGPVTFAPPSTPAVAPPDPVWRWCPECLLVSEKVGLCPGCHQPWQAAPPWGIPYRSYTPPPRPGVPRKSIVIGVAVAAAILLFGGGGITWLAVQGHEITKTAGDGLTAFAVPSLGGTLTLPASWVSDPDVATSIQSYANDHANGAVKTEVSVRRGRSSLAIVSAESADPATIVDNNRDTTGASNKQSDGTVIESSPTKDVTVAGYQAILSESVTRSGTGDTVGRVRVYIVDGKDHFVVIRLESPADRGTSDFATVEQALQTLG